MSQTSVEVEGKFYVYYLHQTSDGSQRIHGHDTEREGVVRQGELCDLRFLRVSGINFLTVLRIPIGPVNSLPPISIPRHIHLNFFSELYVHLQESDFFWCLPYSCG